MHMSRVRVLLLHMLNLDWIEMQQVLEENQSLVQNKSTGGISDFISTFAEQYSRHK